MRLMRTAGPALAVALVFVFVVVRGVLLLLGRLFTTAGGVLVLFLLAGLAIAYWGLQAEPTGMAGNLVAEAAGAFFAAAAIDGVLLLVESGRKRRAEGALRASVRETPAGDYEVTLENRSPETVYHVTVQASGSNWEWAGDPVWGSERDRRTSFAEATPQLAFLQGRDVLTFMGSPGGSQSVTLFSPGGQLPYRALVEWDSASGVRFRRLVTLRESSQWLY